MKKCKTLKDYFNFRELDIQNLKLGDDYFKKIVEHYFADLVGVDSEEFQQILYILQSNETDDAKARRINAILLGTSEEDIKDIIKEGRNIMSGSKRTLEDLDFGDFDLEDLESGDYDLEYIEEREIGVLEGLDSNKLREVLNIIESNSEDEEKYRRVVDILLEKELDFGSWSIDDFENPGYSDWNAEGLKRQFNLGDLNDLTVGDLQNAIDILYSNMSRKEKKRRVNAILLDIPEDYFEEIEESEQPGTRTIRQNNNQNNSRISYSTGNKSN